jgi:Ala-tRNA(Pro) deacylase
MRSADYLAAQRVPFDALPHAPAFCASRRARWLRTAGREVARAVLMVGPDGPFLVVLRSTHEIDLTALARHWGGPLRLARPDEAAAVFLDCEWGAVPAFGNLYGLPTLLDAGIESQDEIVFEVGSHFAGVRMACRDYERLTGALRLDCCRPVKSR